MKRHLQLQLVIALLTIGPALVAEELAKSPAPKDASKKPAVKKTELGVRQQRIVQLTRDLEAKIVSLATKLRESEPEQADRLKRAFDELKKERLVERMDGVAALLNESDLSKAKIEQEAVVEALAELLRVLTEDEDKLREEEKRLERWRKELVELIKEEQRWIDESKKVAHKDETISKLDRHVKALENLIKEQQKIGEQTADARTKGAHRVESIAKRQGEVRRDTERLADAIGRLPNLDQPSDGKPSDGKPSDGKPSDGKPSDGKPSDGKPSDGKPSDGKPSDGKPSDGKPSDGKPSDGKPSDGKPSDGKPSDGKPSDGKPSDGKPSDGKPSDGKPSDGKPSDGKSSSQPGQKPLADAAEHQKDAENDLGKGRGKAAEADQKKALADMKKALRDLKNERQRIASLPPEVFDKMAEDQKNTENKTAQLDKEMSEAAKKDAEGQPGEGQPGEGQPGEGQPGEGQPQPGQQQIQQAQQRMQDAADDLKKQRPSNAAKDQDRAKQDLKKALEDIEKRLAQLREEMRAERLAQLEAHFRRMLDVQQRITSETTAVAAKVRQEGRFGRTEKVKATKLASGERTLSGEAQKALDIILEDGTSTVFPRVVEQLRDDLTSAGAMIDDSVTTGEAKQRNQNLRYTRRLQREIEATLKELIEALERAQQQQQQQQQQPSGPPPPGEPPTPPLLPNSAELKLLRAAQLRVNRRTKSFDDVRPDGPLEGVFRDEVTNIAKQQASVAEMTQQMVERQ